MHAHSTNSDKSLMTGNIQGVLVRKYLEASMDTQKCPENTYPGWINIRKYLQIQKDSRIREIYGVILKNPEQQCWNERERIVR